MDIKLTDPMHIALREKLETQGYHILGERGAYKGCQWQKKSLLHNDVCYKQKFYGIQSHRCLQMTPVVDKCTHNCKFCWRVTPSDVGITWNQTDVIREESYSPEDLMNDTIAANIRSLGGYNPKVNHGVSEIKYEEARNPRHVAISLAGEPTLYPQLDTLINEIHSRGMTSFLVTNGTRPNLLSNMVLPTQLYVTLAAPDEEIYKKICRPLERNSWDKLMNTLDIFSSLSCRRVIRLTMVADRNMQNPRAYAEMILRSETDFVEVKGYMFIGSSRNRLARSNAPSHREVRSFAEKLSQLTGYFIADEQAESRVVLLSRSRNINRIVT